MTAISSAESAALPAAHKRRPPAGPAVVLPGFACFACHDSGLVNNHDRAINEFLPDYDVLPTGEIMSGSDPAVICCCNAAYTRQFRDSKGPRQVETAMGPRALGVEISPDAITGIHRRRREQAYAAVRVTVEQGRQLQVQASREAVAALLPSLGGTRSS